MDRVKPYLIKYMDEFVFSELTDTYLKDAEMDDFLTGVPVPLRADDAQAIAEDGLHVSALGTAMARVMGIDPEFHYVPEYKRFLYRFLKDRALGMLLTEAKEAVDRGDFDSACIWQRAALAISPEDPIALYGYATVLGAMYADSTDEAKIGSLKAESLETFETLTIEHPDFSPGWYWLGYLYLNLGLYTKAKLAWEKYLEIAPEEAADGGSAPADTRKEIEERLAGLDEPVAIENACNLVLSGNYDDGLTSLSHFTVGKYADWWPLWYHIGIAHAGRGETADAEKAFRKVLSISGTQILAMRELVKIYEETNRFDLVKKYSDKIELIEYMKREASEK
jgi:tetratricopeptide (TPR) repeat protein